MIDWWQTGANAVWILGAALLLATFSSQRYEAARARARGMIDVYTYQRRWLYGLGLFLVSLGLCLGSDAWPDRILWGILALISLIVTGLMIWETRRGRSSDLPASEDAVRSSG